MPLRTNDINLRYTLTMSSAFHFGTGLRKGLVHRSVAQDEDGYLYIPGSTLKGSLRNQLFDLHQTLDLPSHFLIKDPHRGAEDLTEFKPDPNVMRFIFGTRFNPCTLFFDDAHLNDEDKEYFVVENQPGKTGVLKQISTRTQVHLSRLTRTAEPEMLFTSEFGLRDLRFEGRIYGRLTGVPVDKSNYTYSLVMLLATLKALSRLGGNKSTGGGEIRFNKEDARLEYSESNKSTGEEEASRSPIELAVDGAAIDPETVLQSLADLDLYQIAWEEL